MRIDGWSIPHYLVLRDGCAPYVLNADRHLLRREASRLLYTFAKTRSELTSIDGALWDGFAEAEVFTIVERQRPCLYALVRGNETEHQLRLLTGL